MTHRIRRRPGRGRPGRSPEKAAGQGPGSTDSRRRTESRPHCPESQGSSGSILKVMARIIRRGRTWRHRWESSRRVPGSLTANADAVGKKAKHCTATSRGSVSSPASSSQSSAKHQLQRRFVPRVNVPSNQLICEKCGSTHFVEAGFRQYQEQYASTPGAEFVAVTEDPILALVCMCGHPIQLRKLRRLSIPARNWGGFQKSFESARRYREAAEPQTVIDRISPTLVNREEYAKLAELIASLETLLRCAFRIRRHHPIRLHPAPDSDGGLEGRSSGTSTGSIWDTFPAGDRENRHHSAALRPGAARPVSSASEPDRLQLVPNCKNKRIVP